MRACPLALLLLLSSCGRYADFHLPILQREPARGDWLWQPLPNPVLTRSSWDSADTLNPSIVARNGTLYNFFSGYDGRSWHTGLATSTDGLSWQRHPQPVLSPTGWEGNYIAANGHALFHNNEFLYWYQTGFQSEHRVPRIALARSPDGISWTRHPTPVLDLGPRGSWDERGVADPYVIRLGGHFYLFYLGQDRARRQRLGLARSPDGITWTKLRANPILELGDFNTFDENGLGEPAVWYSHGSYWMLYTGRDRKENRRMGLARSQDGVHWSRLPSPILAGAEAWNKSVLCDATVEPTPSTIRVWFGGGNQPKPDENLNGQIGYGTLTWQPRP